LCERAAPQPGTDERADAEAAVTIRRRKQEQEAEEHRQLTAVLNRQAAFRGVLDEVRDRHLAARDERGDAREQADQDQRAAYGLDDPGRAELGANRHLVTAERAEQLLRTVDEEEEPGGDAHERIGDF